MLEKFKWLHSISEETFRKKYMINGEESVDEVFKGIAKEISKAEKSKKKRKKWEEKFYEEISSGRFIPAGRILANARPNPRMPYYNNCYTIGIEDNIPDIGMSQTEDLVISSTGGGVGINFSKLRPKNSPLSKGGESSGVISFMRGFNEYADVIHTGGSRRAAHIGILNVDHPEIEDFITCKKGDINKALTQFNISVGITDDFMDAVKNDTTWDLVFEGKLYKTVQAKDLYELMTKNAYEHNEPGIFNIDNTHREANSHYLYKILQTNPCGEQSLPEYGICDLGAVNLSRFVLNPFTPEAIVDWDNLSNTIKTGVRFLDDVLDVTKYPLDKIKKRALEERRIGLGFTGYADMLAMLNIVYGSEFSKEFTNGLGEFFKNVAYMTSISLAKEKRKFKLFNKKILESGFIKRIHPKIRKDIKKYGLRNIAILNIAPTGTTSFTIGQNCSSGIEPIFSLRYDRKIRTGDGDETKTETVYDYAWLKYLEAEIDPDGDIPEYFVTTFDINVFDAIDIQSIWQTHIDASISKTLNLPTGTTYETYNELFQYAYSKNLKGFTTFNPEGSMEGILSVGKKDRKINSNDNHSHKRPKELLCDIHELSIEGNKFIALVGMSDGLPYEIFVANNEDKKFNFEKHKTGKIIKVKKGIYSLVLEEDIICIENINDVFDINYLTLGRLISMLLRHQVPMQFIVEQLGKDKNFLGFERTVSRVLKKYIKEGEKVKTNSVCPECGNTELVYNEGCLTCPQCFWSRCS